jgi:predicted AAA+ superfamily ATPase
VTAYHFRDRDGAEVDLVLEADDGRVVALEVKASATADRDDFRWLGKLRAKLGEDFVHGMVLYCGSQPHAFGDRLSAVPLSYLWRAG